jgi:hypothetical protein
MYSFASFSSSLSRLLHSAPPPPPSTATSSGSEPARSAGSTGPAGKRRFAASPPARTGSRSVPATGRWMRRPRRPCHREAGLRECIATGGPTPPPRDQDSPWAIARFSETQRADKPGAGVQSSAQTPCRHRGDFPRRCSSTCAARRPPPLVGGRRNPGGQLGAWPVVDRFPARKTPATDLSLSVSKPLVLATCIFRISAWRNRRWLVFDALRMPNQMPLRRGRARGSC